MIKKWFITGTDTNVGKTIISAIFLKKASDIGYYTAGYKPIATGCIPTPYGLRNHDALLLQKNSNIYLKYHEVNPFSFKEFIPPNFLIEKYKNVNFYKLSQGLNNIKKKSNWIIIEGIGGWNTPLFHTITLSDWIVKEKIPIILVVGIKLGCINHAILTNMAIIHSGSKLSGWIANCYMSDTKKNILNYINTIKLYIKSPLLGILPFIKNIKSFLKYKNDIILPK